MGDLLLINLFAGIDVLTWGGNKWISTYCCGIKWLNSFEDI